MGDLNVDLINGTLAGRMAQELAASDNNKNDGYIDGSVWNKFVQKIGTGNTINENSKISVERAMKSITTYSLRKAKENGEKSSNDVAREWRKDIFADLGVTLIDFDGKKKAEVQSSQQQQKLTISKEGPVSEQTKPAKTQVKDNAASQTKNIEEHKMTHEEQFFSDNAEMIINRDNLIIESSNINKPGKDGNLYFVKKQDKDDTFPKTVFSFTVSANGEITEISLTEDINDRDKKYKIDAKGNITTERYPVSKEIKGIADKKQLEALKGKFLVLLNTNADVKNSDNQW